MIQPHNVSGLGCALTLAQTPLIARASGALWMPQTRTLVVSDLHLGKAERNARKGGGFWPPYDNDATLARLKAEVAALSPGMIVFLGDSFDDDRCADHLTSRDRAHIVTLAESCETIWVAGNHDRKPHTLPGRISSETVIGNLSLRHIADANGTGEISGHYHPKAVIKTASGAVRRKCFLIDSARLILPAFGAYTGGLNVLDPAFDRVIGVDAEIVLTGKVPLRVPRKSLHRCWP